MSVDQPILFIGSSCDEKLQPQHVAARMSRVEVPMVRNGVLHEVNSPFIVQPGPAALTDGLDALHRIIVTWRSAHA